MAEGKTLMKRQGTDADSRTYRRERESHSALKGHLNMHKIQKTNCINAIQKTGIS